MLNVTGDPRRIPGDVQRHIIGAADVAFRTVEVASRKDIRVKWV